MDKTEYKIRAEEIKSLIREHRFADAVKIADTIDWKRVKSVGMLCAISDLYKMNRRLEESRDILLLAYDRSPTRREIVYSLCELAIAMGEFVQAVEYYKEFVRLAPRNTARYILQYKLYEAQEVSLEERIAVLEEYKKHDYNEKWAYELAYLYHRVGLTTECIEECDELFLYMREGRYVMKALELKSLHEPLSPEQKIAYQKYKAETGGTLNVPKMSQPVMGRDVKEGTKTPTKEIPPIPENFEAGDLAATNTNELPAEDVNSRYQQEQGREAVASNNESAAGYEESAAYSNGYVSDQDDLYDQPTQDISFREEMLPEASEEQQEVVQEQNIYNQDTQVWQSPVRDTAEENSEEEISDQDAEPENQTVHVEYEVPTVNVGDYNTVDLQREIAKNLKQVLTDSPEAALFADARGPQVIKDGDEIAEQTGEMFDTTDKIDVPEEPTMSEVFYEDSGLDDTPVNNEEAVTEDTGSEQEGDITEYDAKNGETASKDKDFDNEKDSIEEEAPEEEETEPYVEPRAQTTPTPEKKVPLADELKDKEIAASIAASTYNEHALYKGAVFTDEPLQDEVPGAVIRPNVRYKSNNHFDRMLSQEYDGQISMAIDDTKQVERQITGQISISDFMTDWESYKKDQQKKQLQNVKNKVASETGELFKDFDQNLIDPMLNGGQEDNTIREILTPGSMETESDVESKFETDEVTASPNEQMPETNMVQEVNDMPIPEKTPQPVTDDVREIKPVDDLQSTRSMVQITGDELEYAAPYEEEEPEKDNYEDMPTDEELAEEYPNDEDLEAEEIREMQAEDSGSIREIKYNVEDDNEAADVDLGETTEIEASEVEEAVIAAVEAKKAADEAAAESKVLEEAVSIDDSAVSEAEVKTEPARSEAKIADRKSEKDEREMETRVRVMTPEEKELFGPYIHHRKSRKQIIEAIDNLSMAAYTNNAIVTGEEGAGTVNLAKGLIKAIQSTDSNFSGKVAMISAITLNKRSVSTILDKIVNGALIIRRAADLKEDTIATLLKQLQNENKGYIMVIEDTKDDIDRLLDKYPALKKCFNVRVDIEALDDDSLVAYAKQYALEKEHVIDNLGILALHQKISERQTLDHEVTVSEVKEMVDDAIYFADKRTPGHVMDIIFRKRYDEEDMIILREKDFLH